MEDIKIEKLDHQGRGIARINDKPFFIPNALPEEVVKVNVVEEKKKYGVGEVEEIIISSKKRIKPICPYFEVCGGCDLMHIRYEDQIQYKQEKVIEIMQKFAHIDSKVIKPIIFSNRPLNYRNKVTFQVDNCVGFYGKKSYHLIPIDYCYIATPKINEVLKQVKKLPLQHIEKVVVKTDEQIEEVMVILEINGMIEEQKVISTLKDVTTSIILKRGREEKTIYGLEYLCFPIGDYQFEVSPSSFFQVNLEQCEKLYQKVVESAGITKEDVVLDLYCGTGTIGIYISKFAKQVYGIELNPDAVRNALKNKKRNQITNIEFVCGDCGKVVKKLKLKPDIVIVDPPRKGLDKDTVTKLLSWNTRTIVYVSCDPITLARDLNLLQEKYNVEMITPVDMFPNTYHVESVVLLQKKDS